MEKSWIIIAAIFGFLAVLFGAIGSHTLAGTLTPKLQHAYETAVRYQMWHSLALLALGFYSLRNPNIKTRWPLYISGWSFIIGIVCFSGGIYFNVFTQINALIYIVPVGGVAFMIGWLGLIVNFLI